MYERRGGHRRARLAYAIEHDARSRALDLERPEHAALGENLTVSALIETDVHLGDVFEVGSALVQVNQQDTDELSRRLPSIPGRHDVPRKAKEIEVSVPEIVSQEEWVAAQKAFVVKEKAATNQRDRLNTERRELPMVEVTKAYVFDGPAGAVSLLDLFEGRTQLIIYHFMFHPEWEDGCPSCTAGTDELSAGFLKHLHTRDTAYAMVSRAPLATLERWKAKQGWDVPWYSAGDGDFNYDFGVTIDASRGFDEFNFRTLDEYAAMGRETMKTADQPYDMPGRTCFLQVDGRVFRTYSQYARGLEGTGGSYYFLDLTALGRQEDWEEPKGRTEAARGNIPDFSA